MFAILGISFLTTFLAEIGDKTQFLTFLLITQFKQKKAIILGILLSTAVNHTLSSFLGVSLTKFINAHWINIILGIGFIIMGLWILIPDKPIQAKENNNSYGAFITSFMLFLLAEIGDKTQLATIFLAGQYHSWGIVTMGSTLGILAANVPVVYFGEKFLEKISFKYIRYLASLVFITFGIISLVSK